MTGDRGALDERDFEMFMQGYYCGEDIMYPTPRTDVELRAALLDDFKKALKAVDAEWTS